MIFDADKCKITFDFICRAIGSITMDEKEQKQPEQKGPFQVKGGGMYRWIIVALASMVVFASVK